MALRKVQSASIADNAITSAKIASDAVTTAKIASGAVTATDVPDGEITAAKLSSTAISDKLGYTPANTGKAIAMAIVFGG